MSWPAVVLWIFILGSLFLQGPALLYLFYALTCFGTLQMIPGEGIGGANLVPQVACAVILIAKIAFQKGNLVRALAAGLDPSRIGLLTAFVLYSIVTAVTLPRIFEGRIEVTPISGQLLGPSLVAPAFGNVTQSGYLALSYATALAFSVVGSNRNFERRFLISLAVGGGAMIASGLVDLATSAVGLTALLDPFRTTSYSLLADNEVLGAKRVVGLMSEASAYGASCVMFASALTFLRPCFAPQMRKLIVPLLIAGLLVMSALSTSSSAYIGLAVFAIVFGANWLVRLASPAAISRDDIYLELGILGAAAFALLSVVVLVPSLLDPVINMVDVMVFQKSSTDSYYIRSLWTRVAWDAFLSTDLLGVGYGGLRTSNWFVSILGSTGLIGGVLMFGFIIRANFNQPGPLTPAVREMRRGLRFCLVPWLVMNWFSGTIPDIGVLAASIYGVLTAAHGRVPSGSLDEFQTVARRAA